MPLRPQLPGRFWTRESVGNSTVVERTGAVAASEARLITSLQQKQEETTKMSKILGLAVVAALAGFVGTANAGDIYASAPAYPGDPTGGSVTCRIFNAGTTGVSIAGTQIIDNAGTIIQATTNSCANKVLGKLKYCAFGATAPGNVALTCRLATTPTGTNLRGAAEVFSSGGQEVVLPMTK